MPHWPWYSRALMAVYSGGMELVVWLALVPALVWRDRAHLRERLGLTSPPTRQDAAPRVLIHAVSLGEMHAAAPLIDALIAERLRVSLTTGTSAGHEAARRLATTRAALGLAGYLPWDRPAIRRWLAAQAPSAVVVLETEIWPNLYRACAEQDIPLFIANGRIRPVDVPRYRLARPLFASVLECVSWIGAQSNAERDRFITIGARHDRVHVSGSLKADAALRAAAGHVGHMHRDRQRMLVVGGSTHAPEERWLLECMQHLRRAGHNIQLVLAPRHVRRAASVGRLAATYGFTTRLWSDGSHDVWDVMVLDRYGTLRTCYAHAALVVLGGTFTPVGGHNILELAAMGRPVIVGPHTTAIAAVVDSLEHANAVMRVHGPDVARALADASRLLLDNPALARHIGDRAAAVCQAGAGSADTHARIIVAGSGSAASSL